MVMLCDHMWFAVDTHSKTVTCRGCGLSMPLEKACTGHFPKPRVLHRGDITRCKGCGRPVAKAVVSKEGACPQCQDTINESRRDTCADR